tara:strand:- start:401 stop:1183 length:783 start_codon:yes stop_codon:yes gene_type:complete
MCLRKSLFFICFFLFVCETKKQDTSDVLARVEGETLTLKKATALNEGSILMKEKLPGLVQDWVTNTVLLKKAKSLGIDQDSSIIKKRDNYFNDLIVSSFINHSFKPNIEISKKEILDYYKNNKEDFSRTTDEVFLEHYFTEKIGISKKLSSFFNSNKKEDINLSDFLVETKKIKKGRSPGFFEPYLFDSKKDLVGPVKSDKGYHFFKILEQYKKGSLIGLDQAHNEIYQRIYKQKETSFSSVFLDSIKNSMEIYINPKYQ